MVSVAERIRQRRMQMLVHSYLYYQQMVEIVSDAQFDRWAKELVKLQKDYPDIAATVEYHKDFEDFDGTTGYHLPFGLPVIQRIGDRLVRYEKWMRNCQSQVVQKWEGS